MIRDGCAGAVCISHPVGTGDTVSLSEGKFPLGVVRCSRDADEMGMSPQVLTGRVGAHPTGCERHFGATRRF